MDNKEHVVWRTLAGDWWYYAAAVKTLLTARGIEMTDGAQGNGWSLTTLELPQDTALLTSADGKTTVHITMRSTTLAEVWNIIVMFLEDMSIHAREMRREVIGPTGEEVIELYYRSRAAGSKITLRQLAKQYGFNPTYLSQVKRQYDTEGKWGSKVEVIPKLGDDK